MGFSIAAVVCDGARRRPEAVALRQGERACSYIELARSARAVGAHLARAGIGIGDRVALMLPNSIEWAQAYYGIQMAGAIPVPMNTLLAIPEAARILADAEPGAMIGSTRYQTMDRLLQAAARASSQSVALDLGAPLTDAGAETFEPRTDRQPGDTAVILYTSGTTGRPKGVELSHFNVFWNAQLFARDLLKLTPEDRCLAVMPLSHVSGHTVTLNAPLFAGASVTLMERFDAEAVLRTISRDRIGFFLGVPAMFWSLLNTPTPDGCDLSSLRGCTSGGQALPEDVHRGFEARFGAEIAEGYGLTEASPNITTNLFGSKRIGTVGRAVWGVEIRVVDEHGAALPAGQLGQVIARGPGIMKGYYRNPQATAEAVRDGWLYTGDIGRLDEQGYLTIVDRIKEIIATGGYKIYPREIEEALYAHPDVLEAAVVGGPDARLGEVPVAWVAPRAEGSLDVDALRAWCAERVSRYKLPRRFRFLTLLPKGATGKVDRLELKRMAAQPTTGGDDE